MWVEAKFVRDGMQKVDNSVCIPVRPKQDLSVVWIMQWKDSFFLNIFIWWINFASAGKWLNYGVIVLVMCFDLNMWVNQVIYMPQKYGQYTNPENRIYTIMDRVSLWTGSFSVLLKH